MVLSDEMASLKAEMKKLVAAVEELSLKMVADGKVELGKLPWFNSPYYSGNIVHGPASEIPYCTNDVNKPLIASYVLENDDILGAHHVFDEMLQPIVSSNESLVSDRNIKVYNVDAPQSDTRDRDQDFHLCDILESAHKVFDKTPVPTFMLEMAQVAQSDSPPVSLVSSLGLPSDLADVTAEPSVCKDDIHLYDSMDESVECIPLKDVQVLGSLAIHRYPEFELEESMRPSQSLLPTIENGDSYMYEDGELEVHVAMVCHEATHLCEHNAEKFGMTSTEHNFHLFDEVYVMFECKSGQNLIDGVQLRDALNMFHYPVSEINPRVMTIEPKSMMSLAPIQALSQTLYFVDEENEVLWLGENHMGSEGVLWEMKPNSFCYQIVFDPGISFLCSNIADTRPCTMFFELKNGWKPLVSYKEIHSWGKFWVRLIRTEGFDDTFQLPSIHSIDAFSVLACPMKHHILMIMPPAIHGHSNMRSTLFRNLLDVSLQSHSLPLVVAHIYYVHVAVCARKGAGTTQAYYIIRLDLLADKTANVNIRDLGRYVFGDKLTTKKLKFQIHMLHGFTLSKFVTTNWYKFFDPGIRMAIMMVFHLTLEDKGDFRGEEDMLSVKYLRRVFTGVQWYVQPLLFVYAHDEVRRNRIVALWRTMWTLICSAKYHTKWCYSPMNVTIGIIVSSFVFDPGVLRYEPSCDRQGSITVTVWVYDPGGIVFLSVLTRFISDACLGYSLGVPGRGMDLLFPYHGIETVQDCLPCCYTCEDGISYWVKHDFVTNRSEKMSKYFEEFYMIERVTQPHHVYPLRLFSMSTSVLSTSYHSPINHSHLMLDYGGKIHNAAVFVFDPGGNDEFLVVMNAVFAADLCSLGLHGCKIGLTFLHHGGEVQGNDTIFIFDPGGQILDKVAE